jgi:hypothetical protein
MEFEGHPGNFCIEADAEFETLKFLEFIYRDDFEKLELIRIYRKTMEN